MKIPNKRELQKIAFNHSSDIKFQDFMNLYKNCTGKSFSFLVIDATLTSDNALRFRKNLQESIRKLVMAIHDRSRDEKLQYKINRKTAKMSALSSGKIDTYEYPISEEILTSNQRQIKKKLIYIFSIGKSY